MESIENKNVIKKGDLFVIKFDELKKLSIKEDTQSEFGYKLYGVSGINEKLKNEYLVCLYLGYGLARESLTSTIFNIIGIDDINICSNCNNYIDFFNKCNKALRYPLSVIIDDNTKLYTINNYYYKNKNKAKNEVKLSIRAAQQITKKEIIKKINEIKEVTEKDENLTYNLKKTFN